MAKRNLILEYSEELAVKIVKLCAEYKIDSNTVFQIKKSSSSVFANITEAQYPQSLADMLQSLKLHARNVLKRKVGSSSFSYRVRSMSKHSNHTAIFAEELKGCLPHRALQ